MENTNKRLLSKLGESITLIGLVLGSISFSGCGKVYFPAGKYPNLSLIQERDTELKTKNGFYRDTFPEPIYLLVYELE